MFERLDAAAAEQRPVEQCGHRALGAVRTQLHSPDRRRRRRHLKALSINEQFQVSRQFWAHAVDNGFLGNPKEFINPIPHVSFTHGADGVEYLRKRHAKLSAQTLFEGMSTSPIRASSPTGCR